MNKKTVTKAILAGIAALGTAIFASTAKTYHDVKKIVARRPDVNEHILAKFDAAYHYADDKGPFTGANIGVAFGSLRLDLGKADIKEDVLCEIGVIMGAATIIVPRGVNVQANCKLIAGAYTAMTEETIDAPTIHITGFCKMGAVVVLESNLETE